MADDPLTGIALILGLGIVARWVAWRMQWPSILVLLAVGLVAGQAVTGLLDPDLLFGGSTGGTTDLLFSLVSLSVAMILFEGGMSLRLGELQQKDVVRRLIIIGGLVTWILSASAAYLTGALELDESILLGAVLIVTGPTVVMPLLRQIRLKGELGPILKWEGILNDPVGAVIAVLTFQVLFTSYGQGGAVSFALMGLLKAVVAGVGIGGISALILITLLRRYWLPDFLYSPATMAFALASFVAAHLIQHESGLIAVTVMGAILANQKWVSMSEISEFKENLRVLLISFLFILLAARITREDLMDVGVKGVIFAVVLVAVVRPCAVFISTIGTKISWRERVFLSFIAPRGIVAAAVSASFTLSPEGGNGLVAQTFLVIVLTIVVCAVCAQPVARKLKLAQEEAKGFVILGSHPVAREIAKVIAREGVRVLLIDRNWANVRKAKSDGLSAQRADIMSPEVLNMLDLEGIGHLLALTSNDEANSLAAIKFGSVFERSRVYQLTPEVVERDGDTFGGHHGGRYLFGADIRFNDLLERFNRGASVKTTGLTEKFDYAAFQEQYGQAAIPLFSVREGNVIIPFTVKDTHEPKIDEKLIALSPPTG